MKLKLKKIASAVLLTSALLGGVATAYADTVYYKGSAVYWDYGRKWILWAYSDVQSSVYEHSSTINGKSSGWKSPGVLASVRKNIGFNTAHAYWNCRG